MLNEKIFKPHIVFLVDAKELVKWRKFRGLTQSELAKKVPVSPQFLCDVEHGRRNCSKEVAIKISKILS